MGQRALICFMTLYTYCQIAFQRIVPFHKATIDIGASRLRSPLPALECRYLICKLTRGEKYVIKLCYK